MRKLVEMYEKSKKRSIGSDASKIKKIHEKGMLTAEERIKKLFDEGTYEEATPWIRNRCIDFDLYKKDLKNEGVICGQGRINNRQVYAYSHDSTILGGSMGEAQGIKISRILDEAMKTGNPIIGINDAGGARIQEGVAALNGYCTVFGKTSIASGWIPQITIVAGIVAGGTAYAATLTDFIIMVKPQAKMFITGPAVIKAVTGEDATFDDLGGSDVHGLKTGIAHFVVDSEEEAIDLAKRLVSFLPDNSKNLPPVYHTEDPTNRLLPEIKDMVDENPSKAFDVRDIIVPMVDNNDFLEIQKRFGRSIVIGFARMNGSTVGIVGNQPKVLAGCIDIDASWKAARFIRFCDSFNIPLITLVDCPGYLPGLSQEHGGIIRNGSKMLFAYSEATVPKITVVLRKDYGGAYSAMCGRGLGADVVLAFPTAELAVMGAEGAANIIFKKELNNAPEKEREALRKKLTAEYSEKFLNPYVGAEYGIVDDIIDPINLRRLLIKNLERLKTKNVTMPYKKHSNNPL